MRNWSGTHGRRGQTTGCQGGILCGRSGHNVRSVTPCARKGKLQQAAVGHIAFCSSFAYFFVCSVCLPALNSGACLGTSPIIIHNETFAGITDGARTGLHSVVVALLFLLCLPFVPLLRAVPPIATAAPLVIVGMHMMMAAKHIRWEETHEAMPAFLCAAILPLTYSIANGMMFGLVAYALLKGAHTFGLQVAPARFQAALEEERHLLEEREQLEIDRKCAACGGSMAPATTGVRERK